MRLADRLTGLEVTSCQKEELPPSFELEITRMDKFTFMLRASQLLPIPPEEAFKFFEDPGNLSAITPAWLDFKMVAGGRKETEVFEGAEFDYTIKWLGRTLPWRSRIEDYRPPYWFRDVQVSGPYVLWNHLHVFERLPEGTFLKDEVTYRLPRRLLGRWLHKRIVKRQLEDIFCYRALKIAAWASGRKGSAAEVEKPAP
jgi:ligand-binding SRPBCC domain-containing protein